MEHNQSDPETEIPSQFNRSGVIERVKQAGQNLLGGDNSRRILGIAGVILLVIVVVVGIRLFYPDSSNPTELLPDFSGKLESGDPDGESVNMDVALEMPSFIEDQAEIGLQSRRIDGV